MQDHQSRASYFVQKPTGLLVTDSSIPALEPELQLPYLCDCATHLFYMSQLLNNNYVENVSFQSVHPKSRSREVLRHVPPKRANLEKLIIDGRNYFAAIDFDVGQLRIKPHHSKPILTVYETATSSIDADFAVVEDAILHYIWKVVPDSFLEDDLVEDDVITNSYYLLARTLFASRMYKDMLIQPVGYGFSSPKEMFHAMQSHQMFTDIMEICEKRGRHDDQIVELIDEIVYYLTTTRIAETFVDDLSDKVLSNDANEQALVQLCNYPDLTSMSIHILDTQTSFKLGEPVIDYWNELDEKLIVRFREMLE